MLLLLLSVQGTLVWYGPTADTTAIVEPEDTTARVV